MPRKSKKDQELFTQMDTAIQDFANRFPENENDVLVYVRASIDQKKDEIFISTNNRGTIDSLAGALLSICQQDQTFATILLEVGKVLMMNNLQATFTKPAND